MSAGSIHPKWKVLRHMQNAAERWMMIACVEPSAIAITVETPYVTIKKALGIIITVKSFFFHIALAEVETPI